MRVGNTILAVMMIAGLGCKGGGGGSPDAGGPTSCGNGHLDPGEVCDDGNTSGGDGCSAACDSDESCGNLVTDATVGEVCDDGNGVDGDGCSADCRSDETCGNDHLDPITGETCDDGNMMGGDGCSANCQSNESCGNGLTDPGEFCDTNNVPTASCDADCTQVICGDSTRNSAANEACDDGNGSDADGCVGCLLAYCGDGHTRTSGPAGTIEQCDDGLNGNNDPCLNSCIANTCHDGYPNFSAEQCDDGDFDDTDECVENCISARCGDGHIWVGVETCDDFNTNNGDGCNSSCQTEVMQMPMTYVISDPGQLVNMPNDCSVVGTNEYTQCTPIQWGFTWFDSTPYTPSTVVVELNRGINCTGGPMGVGTYINGGYTGSFTIDDPGACICDPPEQIYGWGLAGIGSYSVGGSNTFLLDGFPSCIGLSYDEGLGGYARVTVYP
jgi:cysteine-rich repeat protein